MKRRWWDRWPERYELELRELERAGIEYTIDQNEWARGRLVIHLNYVHGTQILSLTVKFPDTYPYLRFEIFAPDLTLPRHQNPLAKNLCLIGRSTANWRAETTVAEGLRQRLPLVLDVSQSTDPEYVAGQEEHQGEPFSAYYPYVKNTAIVIGQWNIDPGEQRGTFRFGLDNKSPLRGAVLEVWNEQGKTVAKADPEIANQYSVTSKGRWVRVPNSIVENNPRTLLNILCQRDRTLEQPIFQHGPDIVAAIFPEEVRWRVYQDAWLFLVREKIKIGRGTTEIRHSMARATRGSREYLLERIPELQQMSMKVVAVVGLGTLGAPSVLELARCGTKELRILDHDWVEPGTIVRWPLGWKEIGHAKTESLYGFVAANYPYSKVVTFEHRLGDVEAQRLDFDVLDDLLGSVDLLYDATAEFGVNHLLSDLAAERRIPYIWVSTTPGAWGGVIGRIRPSRTTGCWRCYYRLLTEGHIKVPNEDQRGSIQPVGCADPTFTGAAVDTGQVALAGVRLAVSTLCEGTSYGYPDIDWDIGIVDFRQQDGTVVAPLWNTYKLDRHPQCDHGSKT